MLSVESTEALPFTERDVALAVVVVILVLVLIPVIGGVVAWAISRRRAALLLGGMACIAGTVIGALMVGPGGPILGLVASAATGIAMSGDRPEDREVGDVGDYPYQP